MPSIFGYYLSRAEQYSCNGKSDELIVTTRRGKTGSATVMNNDKQALLQDDTSYINGDLVTNKSTNNQYFSVGKQSSTEANQCQLRKINATIDISRLTPHFTSGKQDGYSEVTLFSSIGSVQIDVTANMRLYDIGLLPTTTKKIIVKQTGIQKLDRIKFNGLNFQVDAINDSKYLNLYELQVSLDTSRKVIS